MLLSIPSRINVSIMSATVETACVMSGASSLENLPMTWDIWPRFCSGRPIPTRTLGNSKVPIAEIIDLIPLWPASLHPALSLSFPMGSAISS